MARITKILHGAYSRKTARPPRSVEPVSSVFGLDRGMPIDRYYINDFLNRFRSDIRGRVLEIQDNVYTRKFGGPEVTGSDVLHVVPGNPKATMVGNLETGEGIPSNAFDCMIITQTYQFIYDVRAAVRNSRRLLNRSGVLLATFPGLSQAARGKMMINFLDQKDDGICDDYWRFTSSSARRLFMDAFGDKVTMKVYGNVLAASAFLYGFAADELKSVDLDYQDNGYELLIAVRAVK